MRKRHDSDGEEMLGSPNHSWRTLTSLSSRTISQLPGMNATLWFSNLELQTAFNSFHRKEIPLESLLFMVITLTCFIVVAVLGLIYTPVYGLTIPMALALYFGIAMVICGWIFLYCKYCAKYFHKKSTIPWDYYSRILQNVYLILLAMFFALRLYARVHYGKCGSNMFREYIYCNPNADTGGFPEDSTVGAIILIPVYTSIMRDTSVITTTAAYIILSTAVIFAAIVAGSLSPVYIGSAFYMLFTAILVYSNQKQNIRSFVVQQQLSAVIKQNEEMAEELRANELRHMIGNVAHDLKTPLASFVSGLDVIVDIVQDELKKIERILDPQAKDPSATNNRTASSKSQTPLLNSLDITEIKETLLAVLSTVQNNRNINNFMMMTINRCIDYTKASRGLKLVPKYETVDLLETLYLPFKCMGDVSQKVRISLEPLSSAICSHVITDKQWLQENVLCLLSNAVKYSAGGTVNGRMLLTTAEAVGLPREPSASIPINGLVSKSASTKVSPILSDRVLAEPAHGKSRNAVLLVEIEDTGIGMTDEAMANLFNAFKRAQKFAGGTGLGLFSLAKRIEALGGVYGVKKRPDGVQGSLFWFTIPYRPDEQFAAMSAAHHTSSPPTSAGASGLPVRTNFQNEAKRDDSSASVFAGGSAASSNKSGMEPGLKILIVDDSASIQKMMSMMLRRHGHEVDQAENGAAAVALLSKHYAAVVQRWCNRLEGTSGAESNEALGPAYDVVLMDLQMPVMDGLEAMRRIRAKEMEIVKSLVSKHGHKVPFDRFETKKEAEADEVQLFTAEDDPPTERPAAAYKLEHKRRSLHLDFNNSASPHSTQRTAPSGFEESLSRSCHQLMLGVSANSDTDTMQDALNAGADAFISKPFSIDSFYSTYNKCFHITNRVYKPQ